MSADKTLVPIELAVVGHTNTGKTSLLRTLTRNPHFGEVDDRPGTTRHVESARLVIDDRPVLTLYDTPGLEDSMALLDYIDEQLVVGTRVDGPERIARFLNSPESRGRFEQEARVVRTLQACHAGLYVIDARDPVLAKHKDELTLLAYCARPLLPVLNFTHDPSHRLDQWREALARIGLHVIVEFDTVAPALDGEFQLYDRLAIVLDQHAPTLQALKANILKQREQRHQDGCRLVAEMLIDVAAYRTSTAANNTAIKQATSALRNTVRKREQRCVQALLKRYNFDAATFPAHSLPLEGERWAMDLFHPEALKEMGIHVSRGMAAGAVAGATLDALTAGISLGTATLVGAAAGGLWQGIDKWGKRIAGRLQGHQELSVDDTVLRLLIVRQLALLTALDHRGHAAQHAITLTQADSAPESDSASQDTTQTHDFRKRPLPESLTTARAHPDWSTLTDQHMPSVKRQQAIARLVDELTNTPDALTTL